MRDESAFAVASLNVLRVPIAEFERLIAEEAIPVSLRRGIDRDYVASLMLSLPFFKSHLQNGAHHSFSFLVMVQ